jgi:nitrate reductase gamma subunit
MKLFLAAAIVILLFSGDYMRLGISSFKVIALASLSIFFLGFWNRISVWNKGSGDFKMRNLLNEAIDGFFSKECFLAYRLFQKNKVRGIVLALTIWSFIVLTLGSITLSLEYLLRTDLTSSWFFSCLMDYAGLVLLLCISFYLLRRLVVKNARSVIVMDDLVLLFLFLLIVISGLALKGLRIAYLGGFSGTDSPAALELSKIFLPYSNKPDILLEIKDVMWRFHALMAFLLFAYIPFSKQFHMFAAQIVTKDAERRKKQLWGILHE